MNNTKTKILKESLKLFNTNGITKTSLRTIADEAGISVGNLQYHFKKREDIIEALYFELVGKMDTVFFVPSDDLLPSFLKISEEIIKTLYAYNFFLLDFVAITRKNSTIKKHYSELSKRREQETLQMVTVLITNNLLREELLQNEYRSLFKRIEVLSNFWFSSVLIQANHLSKNCIQDYVLLINHSIYPYLTADAKRQYSRLYPDVLDA